MFLFQNIVEIIVAIHDFISYILFMFFNFGVSNSDRVRLSVKHDFIMKHLYLYL